MSELKTIKGGTIKVVTSDPSTFYEGQVWYNITTSKLRIGSLASPDYSSGTWSIGGNTNSAISEMSTTKYDTDDQMTRSQGTTAGNSETYNGTTWSTIPVGTFGSGYGAGMGTKDDYTYANGQGSTTGASTWNGASWSSAPNPNNARYDVASAGVSSTDGIMFGGNYYPPSTQQNHTEIYNGSTWTELNNMNTATRTYDGFGTSSSAISPTRGEPAQTLCESWNGTSWTEVSDMNTPRMTASCAGPSNQSGVCMGGNNGPIQSAVEYWNGTTWSTAPSMPAAANAASGTGGGRFGNVVGGYNGSTQNPYSQLYTNPAPGLVASNLN